MGPVTPGSGGRRSLQDLLDEVGDGLVGYFYHETAAPHFSRSVSAGAYLPPEFTNWRDEQRAWREAAVLFDQSHHMPELFLSGPDALRLLERVGVNSFAGFAPGRAKQLVACTPRGPRCSTGCTTRRRRAGSTSPCGATTPRWTTRRAAARGSASS
jgi:glycine cleavage system aminomethyltransferase T